MKNLSTKFVIGLNAVFAVAVIFFLVSTHVHNKDVFEIPKQKIENLRAELKTEKDIEKLRRFALISVEIESGAKEMARSSIGSMRSFAFAFLFLAIVNVLYLSFSLYKKSKLDL